MYNLYCVFDSEVKCYRGLLIPFRNHAEASRWFSRMINDPQSEYSHTASAFVLMHIGSWADESGELVSVPHAQVVTGLSVKEEIRDVATLRGSGSSGSPRSLSS